MTQFQTGGAKGKGVVDNLFILRGIIDHSVYLNKPTFVTFYDTEKCFDSLWLEDCINSLWENGVQDDTVYLIISSGANLDRFIRFAQTYQIFPKNFS